MTLHLVAAIGKNESRVFHVEFFGDNGSRSWLTTKVLFLFGKGTTHELKTENQSFIKHVCSQNCLKYRLRSLRISLSTGQNQE